MRTRLAALMFLEYAVQGLWSVPLAAFLMGSPHEGGMNMPAGSVALIYATMAIGATVTPLLLGLLCDRLFAMQRMLGVLHLVGAGLLWTMFSVSQNCLDEVEFTFQKLSLAEPAGDSELWRLQWEADSIEVYLVAPDLYNQHLAPRFPTVDRIMLKLGYRPRQNVNLNHPAAWKTPENARAQLEDLRRYIAPALERVRSDPAVLAAADRAFPPLFGLMLIYSCVYMPTIALSNVVAFRNLPYPAGQYGRYRALGTLGWIAAGLFIGFAAPAVSPLCFLFAAIASGVLGVLCFFLPHTPPIGQPKTVGDALGLPALRMLAKRSFLVYVLVALVATALMPFHNIYTNKFLVDLHVDHPATVQTLAQPTEILGAILIPWMWARLGTKWMLTLGLLASAGRFFIYATESVPGMIALGLPLHGIGFAFFYIAAALYVDREAPTDLRASAQGLVTLLTLGLGGIAGNWFAGWMVEMHTAGGVVDWRPVWLIPAVGTVAAALIFAMFFRDQRAVRYAS
jgi:nucleoside transporter